MLFIGYLFHRISFHFVCLRRRASSHRVSSRSHGRRTPQVDYASMTFFRAYDIFFLQILRHKYHDRKTIKKNYVINQLTSSHPEKITSYENGTTMPATTRGIRLVSKSRQLYVDAGKALVFSLNELQFNLVRCLNLFRITKLFSLIFASFQDRVFFNYGGAPLAMVSWRQGSTSNLR